jgi:hypothetical protein
LPARKAAWLPQVFLYLLKMWTHVCSCSDRNSLSINLFLQLVLYLIDTLAV